MSFSCDSSRYSDHFKARPLLIAHFFIALCLCTLFSPLTHSFWQAIDMFIFQKLNQTLAWGRSWQVFWALANHKLADWLEDIVIILFCIVYVKSGLKGHRLYRAAQTIFLILFSAFIIFFINKTLLRDHAQILRDSPTLVMDSSIKLSDHISWLKIKDESSKSFPGDHATTALLFGFAFVYMGSRKMKIFAALYSIFLCLPRMILGAHWFTDVVIGSGSIVAFFMIWAICTPFAHKSCLLIEKSLKFLSFRWLFKAASQS